MDIVDLDLDCNDGAKKTVAAIAVMPKAEAGLRMFRENNEGMRPDLELCLACGSKLKTFMSSCFIENGRLDVLPLLQLTPTTGRSS